jgi:hypothetical protein
MVPHYHHRRLPNQCSTFADCGGGERLYEGFSGESGLYTPSFPPPPPQIEPSLPVPALSAEMWSPTSSHELKHGRIP